MTDAIVTDINEYREKKLGVPTVFAQYKDEHIKNRHNLLQLILDGRVPTTPSTVFNLAFPNGYDPAAHPDDNIDAVFREGVRRGVFESQ